MSGAYLRYWGLAAVAVCVALSGGCAGFGKPDLPPEEEVRLRAQAWADALMARDLSGAYAYTSPNYRQYASSGSYNVFVGGSTSWTSAVVDSVRCQEEVCDVRVMVEYRLPQYKVSNRRPLDYKWLKVDGDWWLYVPAK